jgi:hypothetical protein
MRFTFQTAGNVLHVAFPREKTWKSGAVRDSLGIFTLYTSCGNKVFSCDKLADILPSDMLEKPL